MQRQSTCPPYRSSRASLSQRRRPRRPAAGLPVAVSPPIPPLSPVVVEEPAARPAAEATVSRALAPTDRERPSRVVPFALAGGAVVALGAALAFDLWGDSTYDQAKTETNASQQDDLWHSANDKRYVAEGLAIAGLGCAVASTWLFVKDKGRARVADGVGVAPLAETGRAGSLGLLGFGAWGRF